MTKSHQVTTFANFKSFPRTCVKSVMLILKPPSIFSLTIAQNFWNQLNISISPIVNDHSIVNWLLTLKNLNYAFADPLLNWEIYFPFAIWHIWRNRGLGDVFRDEYGNWKMGFYQQHQGFNATSMELLALLTGIELAYHHKFVPLAIETDSTEYWLKKLQNPPINHNFRDGNKVEHHLANEARTTSTNSNFVMFCSPLTGVISSLAADVAGHIITKKGMKGCDSPKEL
ncbi:hypothetical protein KY284_030112 [Solanum tuberosum]|nr:hypothetical protein KY284_030112 [Solanum tuberosum]